MREPRKVYKLMNPYKGMPEYAYAGLRVIQNEIDGETDTDSYIPMDEDIQNFTHIPANEVEGNENWKRLQANSPIY